MEKEAAGRVLSRLLAPQDIRADEPLGPYTTFRIGGPADFLVCPRTEEQVCAVAAWCRSEEVPLHVLGLGSDVLVADSGVRGIVMRIAENFAQVSSDGATLQVQAGCSNGEVARIACALGLSGYEFACGIPGTIGGAAIMNAGAYGGEFKDAAQEVRCLTPMGDLVDVPATKAAWSYRHSMMGEAGYMVLGATLHLIAGKGEAIQARIDELTLRRAQKQPLDMASAGSTFKRPEGSFVGQLVQEAGLRGFRIGDAQVSEKHTGFIVNTGGATAEDVRRLIAAVQTRVFDHAGVQLVPEVRMWGFEDEGQRLPGEPFSPAS